MMYIIPIVVECPDEEALRGIQKIIKESVSSVIGYGNVLPVPANSEGDFREQLLKRGNGE